ncbi:MAG: VOC family protein [Saccharospirillum sp.]|uniref:VOC family protein n=1 Tax=Saccharospirillum sp. TaxID=2033801 RepID=UPI0032987B59
MDAELNTIIIYARNMDKTADFYRKYFGFTTTGEVLEGLIELTSEGRGLTILVHQAAKSIKLGQAGVKLVFSVQDIEGFKRECAELGLVFGATHQANGYSFSNAKDPDKNTVSISSRAYRKNA